MIFSSQSEALNNEYRKWHPMKTLVTNPQARGGDGGPPAWGPGCKKNQNRMNYVDIGGYQSSGYGFMLCDTTYYQSIYIYTYIYIHTYMYIYIYIYTYCRIYIYISYVYMYTLQLIALYLAFVLKQWGTRKCLGGWTSTKQITKNHFSQWEKHGSIILVRSQW